MIHFRARIFASSSTLLEYLISNSATSCSQDCIVVLEACSVFGLVGVIPLGLAGCVTLEYATDLSAPVLGSK